MYETRIAADQLTVVTTSGLAPEIDTLAACNLSGHGFLRRGWYAAGSLAESAATLVLCSPAGTPLAAIPSVPFGPAIAGARKVPGSYWPLRAVLIAPDCSAFELAQALSHPAAARLGPVWRVGPARADDPATLRLIAAAQLAGWTVLHRPAGTSWVIDCGPGQWPRASTAKRIARIERRLATIGTASWRYVRGPDWNDAVLEELGAVEAASWIASATDGSGAKFLTGTQRAAWRTALADPVLADMLCATLLSIDGRTVAFSFDLDDGPVRYGIAGSYVTAFGSHGVGKLANYRAIADAQAAGQTLVDMGCGDSGYKGELGARAGYDFADLLFVKSRTAARLLARMWGAPIPHGKAIAEVARG
ncbi:MAG: GNAT family N-acetyltransferase [Porphyrobacter sp.]|nr:GNAT family N-acetyltransferase [Porphyrobacter sp.]